MAFAEALTGALGVYVVGGLVFAAAFHARGLRRLDPSTIGTGAGFRLMITPGIVALWPFLLRRWIRARK